MAPLLLLCFLKFELSNGTWLFSDPSGCRVSDKSSLTLTRGAICTKWQKLRKSEKWLIIEFEDMDEFGSTLPTLKNKIESIKWLEFIDTKCCPVLLDNKTWVIFQSWHDLCGVDTMDSIVTSSQLIYLKYFKKYK